MAGRPRTPTNILALKGSFKKNPDRLKERENEPENIKPIGEPKFLTELETEFYHEIIDSTIPGVLGGADRLAVEEAARLLVVCRGMGEEPAKTADRTQFFKYLGQLGMLPADRSKISIAKPKKKSAFDD